MKYILINILLLTSFFTNAQTWKNYSSFSDVNDFVLTSDNTIWAATTGGIFNYNGKIFTTLTKTEGISSQSVSTISEDINGNIWLGTEEGYLNILVNSSPENIHKIFDIYTSNNDAKSINSITSEGDTVFVATDFGLSLISAKTFNFIETATKFGDFNSKAIVNYAVKENGKTYVCTVEGLAIEKDSAVSLATPDSWQTFSFANAVPDYPLCTKVFHDTLFVGTNTGVYLFENNSLTLLGLYNKEILQIFVHNDSLFALTENTLYKFASGNFITVINNSDISFRKAFIDDGKYYFSTADGILKIENGDEEFLYPNSPEKNIYSEISIDNDGTLWVATGKDPTGVGIFSFDGNAWQTWNKSNHPELTSNNFYKVYSDKSNTTYFLNWGNGFATYNNGKIKEFNATTTGMEGIPGHPNYLVTSGVRVDTKGNLWIVNLWSGNNTPINVMTTDSVWYHFSQPLFAPSDVEWFEHLVIDQYGTKWFANVDGHTGLFFFNENGTLENTDDDTWGRLTANDGLSSSIVNDLAIDKNGELWVATNKGLNVIPNPSNPGLISEIFSMRTKNINSILVDPLNNKWVGTNDGAYYLSADGFTVIAQYNKKNSPLPADRIIDIGFDKKNGTVYFLTDYGISSLKTDAVQPLQKLGELFVYPNPFVLGKHDKITIDKLAANSFIKIFTIDGKLVASSESGNVSSPGGRVAFWNGKDFSGNNVSTGVYLIVAYNEDGSESSVTKIAVIRN